ncbi:MAG: DNA polymerase ligase N-terminal domain-containing protein, partial [Pseudorhizobium sp.]
MALESYNEKRNFDVSPEPKGTKAKGGGNSFTIQKHAARRLHYDFRIEMDGVLKSWAVTRGPSLVPGEKRLAVHVEDHPLDYGDFEGTIPEGNYGAGAVLLWDRGTWEPVGDMHKGYAKGHLELELKGEKLQGRWHLVRMANRRGEKRENWLLIKSEDEFARAEADADILEEMPQSVKSGQLIEEIQGKKVPKPRRKTAATKPDAANVDDKPKVAKR